VEETLNVKRLNQGYASVSIILAMVLAATWASRDCITCGCAARAYATEFWGCCGYHRNALLAIPGLPGTAAWPATAGGAAVHAAASLGSSQREMSAVVLDTDTTVHTLFGNQMGARKSYNPKKQRQEKLSTDPDISGRDQGILQMSRAIATVGRSPIAQLAGKVFLGLGQKVRSVDSLFLAFVFRVVAFARSHLIADSVCTVVSGIQNTALNLTLAASQTRCRMHRCTSSSCPATLPCRGRNRQKCIGVAAAPPKFPSP